MAVLSDPISDFLTRFKNASRAGNETFTAPHSKIKVEIARLLEEQGYIWGYEVNTSGKFPEIVVKNKFQDGKPALTDVKRMSKPGIRRYVGADDMPRVLNGLGIAIVSTSRGIMTGHAAKRQNIGGELIAYVW